MDRTAGIDRHSPLPLYWQLIQLLADDITSRGLQPGDRLPGEYELGNIYDVSRTVVRQALLELEHDGVIRREKGRGTFVGGGRRSRGLGRALVGTFEDIQIAGDHQRTHLLRREVVPATTMVARDLQLVDGDQVVEIERVREVDEVPWAFTQTQLPIDVGSPLLEVELTDVSLFGILENQFGFRFERAKRTITAGTSSDEVARILQIPVGAPVLLMRSVSFNSTGRPIERFLGVHRGDRSRLDVEVTRAQSGMG